MAKSYARAHERFLLWAPCCRIYAAEKSFVVRPVFQVATNRRSELMGCIKANVFPAEMVTETRPAVRRPDGVRIEISDLAVALG